MCVLLGGGSWPRPTLGGDGRWSGECIFLFWGWRRRVPRCIIQILRPVAPQILTVVVHLDELTNGAGVVRVEGSYHFVRDLVA